MHDKFSHITPAMNNLFYTQMPSDGHEPKHQFYCKSLDFSVLTFLPKSCLSATSNKDKDTYEGSQTDVAQKRDIKEI